MYQQQAFHTANYRGNQQGHDQYLRADSQQPSTFASTPVTSQYRGFQKTFQPTGQVQSFYNPERNPQAGFNTNTFSNQITSGQFTSAVNPQSYHTANYRGDQPGHDQYLRADSVQPNNMGTMGAAQSYAQSGYSSAGHTGYPTTSSVGSAFNQTGQGFTQSTAAQGFQSPQSFHTASYRGDQPGHDQYLRADSVQPNNAGAFGANRAFNSTSFI